MFTHTYTHTHTQTHTHLHTTRIAGLCKDYCGLLNEEAIRLNFVLIYELLDEVLVRTGEEVVYCHSVLVDYIIVFRLLPSSLNGTPSYLVVCRCMCKCV